MSKFISIKQSVKTALNAMGIEAHRFNPAASKLARLMAALRTFNIDLVFDVGANDGQFGQELRAGGYSGQIVSVEPMVSAHARLSQVSQGDVGWHVHPRCAVGDKTGVIELNIAGNSVSSSVLPMLASHSKAAPESAYQGKETVPLTTLDLIVPKYLGQASASLIKIDTQGYEWQVLDGAREIIPRVRGILMEVSLIPLYEGQRLWQESIARLEAEGFVLWALEPVFVDSANGRTLQMDALLLRV
ncbi:MAG: FkbM family methyltransferase [Polaromonas sp.]|nr:FkbM family methyltransferase [Polaromonas sp.]